ncbi:uroporphyrinogen-III synthase [Gulosibacter sp. ACHW.36C]|uniref:Uroporphyrinogen-III synthase n=1 Tax=Gulosibacter sediminis TaxID=1729695 RepID=A0ABY4MXS7_9MICO|nr:uroporphyrinogen-III synthase [Gulosibacter sediminis]UQN14877.1 uroporphyrinogen-III synthase [Gulosibacter sediminis]
MNWAGTGILIPGAGDLAHRCAALVRERGGEAFVSQVLEFRPPEGGALERLQDALAGLRADAYDWLVVTSPRAVGVLRASEVFPLTPGTRVASVGRATALALRDAGVGCDFVPGDESAAGLVAEWSETGPGRVLLPNSNLAHPTVFEGLTARGYEVDVVTAYVTMALPLAPKAAAALADGRVHAVLVTSGTVGLAIADELRAHPDARIVAIGPQTTADLRAHGLTVAAESQQPTAESLLDATARALGADPTTPQEFA